jgi:hypothetical protein
MNVGRPAAILIAVMLLGCAIQVGHGYPKPNVDLSPREIRLGISFAPEVADELTVTTQGLRPIQIHEWHGTLMQGFLGVGSHELSPLWGPDSHELSPPPG